MCLCVRMRTRCSMQNFPLAAVKIHAKQTRDGNNRRHRDGVGGWGGMEARRQMESWTVRQSRRGLASSWQWRLSVPGVCCKSKKCLVAIFFLWDKCKNSYICVPVHAGVCIFKSICMKDLHHQQPAPVSAQHRQYICKKRVCSTQLGMDPGYTIFSLFLMVFLA